MYCQLAYRGMHRILWRRAALGYDKQFLLFRLTKKGLTVAVVVAHVPVAAVVVVVSAA